ncbi:universal stress protein [Nocardia australiensis]|uniref:universal stress protein n=1 Tax=Nocardia australiensis TaxID=2887191 RepID=UPI001D13AD7B|nr:universal stress protein [Nocardia australiensis]
MTNDHPIIASVDGSASSYQAAAWAALDAALRRRSLHLITSMALPTAYAPGVVMEPQERDLRRTEGERILTEAARIARQATDDELDLTTGVGFDAIIPTLIERSKSAALLAVGSRGLGAFRESLLGSVSTAIAHHAHCPVAVVHENAATDPVSRTRPVLVGVDGTSNSVPAVEVAFEEASRRNVGLIALHTWSDVSSVDLPVPGWDAARESEEAVLAESMAGWNDRYPNVPVRRIVTCNRPARSLLDESSNAQLLVVGSHGRGGFAGMILGSTSNVLLRSVECPLIVVREP